LEGKGFESPEGFTKAILALFLKPFVTTQPYDISVANVVRGKIVNTINTNIFFTRLYRASRHLNFSLHEDDKKEWVF